MTDQIYYMTVRVKYDQGTVKKYIFINYKYSICMTYLHTHVWFPIEIIPNSPIFNIIL